MSAIVFVGPTLRRHDLTAAGDTDFLPPVAQGDIYAAVQRRPRSIGIIDGYFSGAPSVWHKEVLWALSQGIPVFGSASMGALRAAELHGFGMRGVGRIFEAFRDGVLEDDDEVAVVHGPAETGFVAASEPMVNIRATLERAQSGGIIGPAMRSALEAHAKSLFFAQRDWPAILDAGAARGLEIAKLREWLGDGRVDQKRDDALAMLTAMQEPAPLPAGFQFQRTHFWEEMIARRPTEAAPGIVDELRLEGPDAYLRVRSNALLRRLAGIESRRSNATVALGAMRETLARLRQSLGLFTRDELDAWMARNHLDAAALERLVEAEARAQAVTTGADAGLLDELRWSGVYERLAARARDKSATLAAQRGDAVAPVGLALRAWFFERRLHLPLPDDMATFARELGYENLAHFDSALRREWLYSGTRRVPDA